MSNQIGLMLSLIFVGLFVLFSYEVITYQTIQAKAMSLTNSIAFYIETNGYDENQIEEIKSIDYFDTYSINSEESGSFTLYKIITKKEYVTISRIYDFLSKEIVCEVVACRKENNGGI